MRIILGIIKEIASKMSISAFLVSFVGLVVLEIISYLVGKNIKNNQSIENYNTKLLMRISEFIIFLTGISICFLGYWLIKEIKSTSEILAADLLFPVILFIIGNVMYHFIKKINRGKDIEDDEFVRNRKFLMFVTLICLTGIGFIAKNQAVDRYAPNTGLLILNIIVGRFLWFDTNLESFKKDIMGFKPTKSYFKEMILPIFIINLIFLYIITKEENIVYGVFGGVTTGVILTVIIIIIVKLKEKF